MIPFFIKNQQAQGAMLVSTKNDSLLTFRENHLYYLLVSYRIALDMRQSNRKSGTPAQGRRDIDLTIVCFDNLLRDGQT